MKGLKAANPRHRSLDPEMITLDPLLQVLGDVMQRFSRQEPVFPGGCDGRRIGSGPIRADPIGREQGLVFQHLAEEALGCPQVALRRQEKVDRRAVLVDGPVQVSPLAADPNVGVTTRSVQNRTLSRKPSKVSVIHKRLFVKWISVERKILRLFLSKPSFSTVPKGKGDLKGSLAYDF